VKKLDEVALVIVDEAAVKSVTVSLLIVVVARLEVDVAVKVPATKLVVVALVAVRLVKNPVIAVKMLAKKLDEVAFVVDAFVAKRLVEVLLVVEALIEKRLVEVLLVVEALIEKRLVVVAFVVELLTIVILPFEAIVSHCVPVEEATAKRLSVSPDTPVIARLADGVVLPIPTFPLARTVSIDTPVDDATLNGLRSDDVAACTLNA